MILCLFLLSLYPSLSIFCQLIGRQWRLSVGVSRKSSSSRQTDEHTILMNGKVGRRLTETDGQTNQVTNRREDRWRWRDQWMERWKDGPILGRTSDSTEPDESNDIPMKRRTDEKTGRRHERLIEGHKMRRHTDEG